MAIEFLMREDGKIGDEGLPAVTLNIYYKSKSNPLFHHLAPQALLQNTSNSLCSSHLERELLLHSPPSPTHRVYASHSFHGRVPAKHRKTTLASLSAALGFRTSRLHDAFPSLGGPKQSQIKQHLFHCLRHLNSARALRRVNTSQCLPIFHMLTRHYHSANQPLRDTIAILQHFHFQQQIPACPFASHVY